SGIYSGGMNPEDTARKEKHYTKEHILYDSTYTKFTGALDPQYRELVGRWLDWEEKAVTATFDVWCH
ncbi:hypothetical protein NL493_30325, partial [Klebsiella pneumoniae]|nr:hypothetical protein [Klebsiella pneumoniae]